MDRRSDSPGAILKKLFNEPVIYYNPVKEKDYSPKSKPAAGNPAGKNTGAGFNIDRYIKENFNKQTAETPVDIQENMNNIIIPKEDSPLNPVISQKRLQEAIIWSEIVGKPVCKRHRRKY